MPGRGPAPNETRRRTNVPIRGEYRAAPGIGWQHGPVPEPPEGLMAASLEAWQVWMGSWFAAHWSPVDLPALRQLIKLFDKVEQGEYRGSTELRISMDTYGITPKGQQDRRWRPPEDGPSSSVKRKPASPYAHLARVK